jgi:aminoglycoside phosphotransferase (APT) family kinase protein
MNELGFREGNREMPRGPGWAMAASVLREVLTGPGQGRESVDVGWVQYLGEGLTHVTYGATPRLADGQERSLVVRLPRPEVEDDQRIGARREEHLLRHLQTLELPFLVPRVVSTVPVEGGLAVVQEWLAGIPVDLRASRFPGGRPWELVGRVAAGVHAVDPEPLRHALAGFGSRQEHALAFAGVLESVPGSDGEDVRGWVRGHLPPDRPSSLLHGDLLGQNLLLSWDDGPPVVLDWSEATLGDPAYDLAIVTRGARRPFQVTGGLQRLLEEYNRHAERPLSGADVHVYELCLRGKLYQDAVADHGAGSAHAESLQRAMIGVLRRAGGA